MAPTPSAWTLHLGDCLAPASGLAMLPDRSVDHAIFDGPYSAHVHASCRSGLTANNRAVRDRSAPSQISQRKELGFDAITPEQMAAIAVECARVVRRWSISFSDVESCHLWRAAFEAAGLEYIRTLLWDKHGGAPQFTGDRPAVGFEVMTLVHQPGRKRWNGSGKRGVYSYSIVLAQRGKGQRLHTAQKPVELMEALVRDFTNPGDVILDPFAGSGTTGAAALHLGRRFIGWERDPKYHATASARLAAAREHLVLPFGTQRGRSSRKQLRLLSEDA